MRKIECHIHYGDADHRPMQTVRFVGSKAELASEIADAVADGWPVRIQTARGIKDGATFHRRHRSRAR